MSVSRGPLSLEGKHYGKGFWARGLGPGGPFKFKWPAPPLKSPTLTWPNADPIFLEWSVWRNFPQQSNPSNLQLEFGQLFTQISKRV